MFIILESKNDAVYLFKSQGIDVIDLRPINLKHSFLRNISLILKLNNIVRKKNINIIHTHSWDADWYGYLTTVFNKTRFIMTIHNVSHFSWSIKHLRRCQKFMIPKASQIICVCDYLKQHLLKTIPPALTKSDCYIQCSQ